MSYISAVICELYTEPTDYLGRILQQILSFSRSTFPMLGAKKEISITLALGLPSEESGCATNLIINSLISATAKDGFYLIKES